MIYSSWQDTSWFIWSLIPDEPGIDKELIAVQRDDGNGQVIRYAAVEKMLRQGSYVGVWGFRDTLEDRRIMTDSFTRFIYDVKKRYHAEEVSSRALSKRGYQVGC